MKRISPTWAFVGLLVLTGCGGPGGQASDTAADLDERTRHAYVAEDAAALQLALTNTTPLAPGLRDALELSRLLQDGDCRREALETILGVAPNWVAYVEHGDCAAQIGRERQALEDFVRAVDLADTPESVDYVVRRVCRAADDSGLETLAVMCVGYVP